MEDSVSPFCMCACWVIPGAGYAIPGAVRVSSQAAVCTSTSIHVTLMESDLGHGRSRSNIELLLQTSRKREATGRNGQNSHWALTPGFSHSYTIASVDTHLNDCSYSRQIMEHWYFHFLQDLKHFYRLGCMSNKIARARLTKISRSWLFFSLSK